MIELGPLKLEDAIGAGMGIREGRYRRLATGEEVVIQAPRNSARFNFKMERWKRSQLMELARNNQIGSMPIYTGQEYMGGNQVIRTVRETSANWYMSDYEIVTELVGDYTRKFQDIQLRYDDWTVLLKEDFQEASAINETLLPKFRSLHGEGTHTISEDVAVSGTKCWKFVSTGRKMVALFGTHWRNYRYSAWIQTTADDKHGLVWRAEEANIEGWTDSWSSDAAGYANRGRHYRLVIDTTTNSFKIEYHSAWGSGDSVEEIYEDSQTLLVNSQWYLLAVITIGDTHYCFVNGQLIHYFEDTRAKGGMVGVVNDTSTIGRTLYVDDVLVHEVPYSPIVLDESYAEPSTDALKTRETPRGTIGYFEHPDVSYKTNAGGLSCVLHYRFDQPYGNKAFDLSGNGNHGEICGASWSDEGFMKFTQPITNAGHDGTFIRVPHDSSLNTSSEGTLIIRMRLRGKKGDGWTWPLVTKGTSSWTLRLSHLGTPVRSSLLWCAQEDGSCSGDSPYMGDHDIPEGYFQTYIIRWDKARDNAQILIDGLLGAGPIGNGWAGRGSDNTDDLLIGNAEVEIEYVMLYDSYLEFPTLPDGFGVRLLDVDSHHEHEIFDVRWNDELTHVREYWNDLSWTTSGVDYLDDLTWGQDAPLVFRRGGSSFFNDTDYAYCDLPSYISSNLHKSDWTLEVVVTTLNSAGSSGTQDIVSIGDTTGATQTIGLSLYKSASGYIRATFDTSSGTETADLFNFDPLFYMNRKGNVIHFCYTAKNKTLKCYMDGKHTGSMTLTGDINSTLDRMYLGKRNASGTGINYAIFYRVRIIAAALNKQEVREIFNEYVNPPVQVFAEHEFKGYPELTNGLLTVRPTTNLSDNEIGDRVLFEIYDDGYTLIQGGSTNEPMDVHHKLDDESDTYTLRLLDMPVVRSISQDHVELECRNQFRRRDPYLPSQGLHTRQRMELVIGAFAIDTELLVSTRCSNWELYLEHTGSQVLWQEGSWQFYQETSGDDIWRTFVSANSTGAAAKILDGTPSNAYFTNYTVMANWSNIDFVLGVIIDRFDDHMYVNIAADAAQIETPYFDDIGEHKLRTTIAMIPFDKSKVYQGDQTFTPSNFATQSSVNDAIDDNVMRADQLGSVATLVKNISYEPGIYRLFFDFVFSSATHFLLSIYDGSGYYRALRKQYMASGFKTEQMWWDIDMVVNAISSETLTTKLTLRDSSNTGSNRDFDGAIILPLWNGADFLLDQLYLARQLKVTRRL